MLSTIFRLAKSILSFWVILYLSSYCCLNCILLLNHFVAFCVVILYSPLLTFCWIYLFFVMCIWIFNKKLNQPHGTISCYFCCEGFYFISTRTLTSQCQILPSSCLLECGFDFCGFFSHLFLEPHIHIAPRFESPT